ncbi:MAG: hypothetical protein PHD56_07815 [Anaerostipes sp.]|nr:hypothetical protein [Anaerostipes sp.]
MRNIDSIVLNLNLLKEQYEEHGNIWWEDEYGSSLVWQIACHPVFSDSTPCLNKVRGVEFREEGWDSNCEECKARWLMEIYE